MSTKSTLAAGEALYVAATKQRMARAVGELSAILQADAGDMRWVLRRVREQEKAARMAGFQYISRMCQEMAECADDARGADRTWLLAVAATLLDTCQSIEAHADGITKSTIHRTGARGGELEGRAYPRGPVAEDDAEPDSSARPPPREGRHVHWRLAGQAATP